MEAFLAEWGENGRKTHPNYHKKFTELLARVDMHPNRRYFVLKSIILNNLYAVDIMEEAVEICKLRLFLKLAAQVEPNMARDNLGIEPLPDIDFNIRVGNSLVGYAMTDEVRRCMKELGGGQMKLMDEEELGGFARFNTRCADVEHPLSSVFAQAFGHGDTAKSVCHRQSGIALVAENCAFLLRPLSGQCHPAHLRSSRQVARRTALHNQRFSFNGGKRMSAHPPAWKPARHNLSRPQS
jgi:hypothetical protein